MPIEDVDFLLENSEKDNYLIFVDSSSRNKAVFPSAAIYEVTFSEPFKNVFGIELMDAMVPSTMYNIDVYNDVMKYYIVYPGQQIATEQDMFIVIDMLYKCNSQFRGLIDQSASSKVVVMDKSTRLANGIGLTPVSTLEGFFAIDFDMIVVLPQDYVFLENVESITHNTDNNNVMLKTNADQWYAVKKTDAILYILQYIELGEYTADLDDVTGALNIKVAMMYNISSSAFAELNLVNTNNVYGYSDSIIETSVMMTIEIVYIDIEHGNYDISTLSQYLNNALGRMAKYNTVEGDTTSLPFAVISKDTPVIVKTSSEGTIEKQVKYMISIMNPRVKFYLDLNASTCKETIGFSSYVTTLQNSNGFKKVKWVGNNQDVVSCIGNNTLMPPGIVNLTGLRYILLRCPEIESHLYNSFAYSQNCPGVAMFKLGSVNQITNVRIDFVNFAKKPFHPIGRLSKLTFRFEAPNGQPYDFKGVDHNMVINIKFYVPLMKKDASKKRYILNPSYNPNYLDFLANNTLSIALDDQNQNTNMYQKLLEEQNKYDYSSEDGDDDDRSEINLPIYLRR